MFLRALFAFLALPGMEAGVIPVLIVLAARNDHAGSAAGFGVIGFGLLLLLWCMRDFYVLGKGPLALAPAQASGGGGIVWSRPQPHVYRAAQDRIGLERSFGSAWLALYLLALAVGFHLRVVLHEEPWFDANSRERGEPIPPPSRAGCRA